MPVSIELTNGYDKLDKIIGPEFQNDNLNVMFNLPIIENISLSYLDVRLSLCKKVFCGDVW